MNMKKTIFILISALMVSLAGFSQDFEKSLRQDEEFENVKVDVGADFAMQYQILDHQADSALIPLGTGINLPTANLIINAALADGITVNLSTYLSSRHHVEAWVKGGYLLMEKLPFLNSSAVNTVMDYIDLKIGVMEINFGDSHFRRSDNGNVINNPFVGNYILDAFTTAPALEVFFDHNGIIAMGAVSTGSLRPQLAGYSSFSGYTEYNTHEELAFYWKGGYDKQITDDFRLRATLSGYHVANHHFGSLYNGDRAGSRYYLVMKQQTNSSSDVDPASGHTTGRWGPGLTNKNNSYMLNLFTKFKGFEVFGTYEKATGTTAFGGLEFDFNQIALEGLYRFGKDEQFFAGARYNSVSNDQDMSVNRIQVGGGWFMLDNVVMKAEYVNQQYNDFISSYGEDAGFNGLMLEAAISF